MGSMIYDIPPVEDTLSNAKPIAWASAYTDGWQFFDKKESE